MPGHRTDTTLIARRTFLQSLSWTPALLLPAPFHLAPSLGRRFAALPFDDRHAIPNYPSASPLDEVLRLVTPGLDQFLWEQYAAELQQILTRWAAELQNSPRDLKSLAAQLHPAILSNLAAPGYETKLVSTHYEVRHRKFDAAPAQGIDTFLDSWRSHFADFAKLHSVT